MSIHEAGVYFWLSYHSGGKIPLVRDGMAVSAPSFFLFGMGWTTR